MALKSYKVSKPFSDIILFSSTSCMPDMTDLKTTSIKFDRMKSLSETAGNTSISKNSEFYTWYHQVSFCQCSKSCTVKVISTLSNFRKL